MSVDAIIMKMHEDLFWIKNILDLYTVAVEVFVVVVLSHLGHMPHWSLCSMLATYSYIIGLPVCSVTEPRHYSSNLP